MGTTRPRALVVDDDPVAAESLAEFLSQEGWDPSTAMSGEEALRALAGGGADGRRGPAVAIVDVTMPGMDGVELLKNLTRRHPATAVVMLTGYGTIESAVEALRLGAADYLTKPVVDAELRIALERAMRQHALAAENESLKGQLDGLYGLENVVGADPRMRRIFELVEAVSASKTTVLICGESGVGKSMIARAIHQQSGRRGKPFVELSCGSIPETLLESELFGHVKGAYTGAHADKVGRFLAADGGTIFLDEINSASPGMQLKLLRVLQERRFEPVGGSETIEVDVRVILATNQPLEKLVAEGAFRQDLYYRVNVVRIEVPPLRERVSDVPMLARHFLDAQARELGRCFAGFTDEAMAALQRYPYPGNVRELSNIVERAAVLSRTPTIGASDLPADVSGEAGDGAGPRLLMAARGGATGAAWTPMTLEQALREPEREILGRALAANDWNRQKTADQLGINRTTLYKKMKALGIGEDQTRRAS